MDALAKNPNAEEPDAALDPHDLTATQEPQPLQNCPEAGGQRPVGTPSQVGDVDADRSRPAPAPTSSQR